MYKIKHLNISIYGIVKICNKGKGNYTSRKATVSKLSKDVYTVIKIEYEYEHLQINISKEKEGEKDTGLVR